MLFLALIFNTLEYRYSLVGSGLMIVFCSGGFRQRVEEYFDWLHRYGR